MSTRIAWQSSHERMSVAPTTSPAAVARAIRPPTPLYDQEQVDFDQWEVELTRMIPFLPTAAARALACATADATAYAYAHAHATARATVPAVARAVAYAYAPALAPALALAPAYATALAPFGGRKEL